MGTINFEKNGFSGLIDFETDVFDTVSPFVVEGSWEKSELIEEINSLVDSLPAHTGLSTCSPDQASPEDVLAALGIMGFAFKIPSAWEETLKVIAIEDEEAEGLGVCY
ncbi:hypothetical protein [Yersinia ruckeri]|uniref:hypothetical protein n=1 Tax=Yersinia ruckeri TaxID=29486 RepID=UPI0020C055D2|nr:hypothetical protein [Yersinia ruckeri]EKN4689545.1 hypothetical protein [Yersinia ruckeri]MCK8586570.1 hypothetical protein [Yersinia ruckeri]MCW6615837.1 hypothetical protein [Yersinia ruckeri]